MADESTWRQCNICKTPIAYQAKYYVCSVSTCNRKRTGLIFCSMPCFDAHLPMMRHRDAWAEEERAPTREQALAAERAEQEQEAAEQRSPGSAGDAAAPVRRMASAPVDTSDPEVLVVVSKLKKFIKTTSGMNTSDTVFPVLSKHLRELSVAALRQAAAEGRKTVLDRDFIAVLRPGKDAG